MEVEKIMDLMSLGLPDFTYDVYAVLLLQIQLVLMLPWLCVEYHLFDNKITGFPTALAILY